MKTERTELENGIFLYTVTNGRVSFCAMNYGCTLTNLFVPDKNGKATDILLGYDSLAEWKAGTEAHNAIVGRVANRIRGAAFSLDGVTYSLDKNDKTPVGTNCLHGGFNRFEKMVWQSEAFSADGAAGVRFVRTSADGEQGFPGAVQMTVTYTLTDGDELILEYTATTDKATPLNLTNHAYFNLDGAGAVMEHRLQLDCDEVLELGSDFVPTGKVLSVSGTPFDFRTKKAVGKDVAEVVSSHLARTGADVRGYDHCFVTRADESAVVRLGEVRSEKSGIAMRISTNQRGVQVYTGNFLEGVKGKGGVTQHKYDGICFETQRFPNAINEPAFPSCLLQPDERYWSKTIFSF